jgi:hypothetical protein
MNTTEQMGDASRLVWLILVVCVSSVCGSSAVGSAETAGSTESNARAVLSAPDPGSRPRESSRDGRRQASERARARRQELAQNRATPAVVILPDVALSGIGVSFKMDPRLLGGTYGGERWISPPTYFGAGGQDTVEARALGIGPGGQPVPISPTWTPADLEMVEVSPREGHTVKITVKRAGESLLEVASRGVTKTLLVTAEHKGSALHVQLSQKP